MSLDSVVVVNIDRETRLPTQRGFGVPAILSTEANSLLADRVTTFDIVTALEDLVAAGFTTSSQTYKAAAALASQRPRVEEFKVIKQAASVAQVEVVTIEVVANAFDYIVTLDGVAYEFTSDADATDVEIQAGLIALLNPLAKVNAVATGTDQITITAANAGEGFSISVGDNLSVAQSAANLGPVEEIISARDIDDNWYFLLDTTHTPLQVKLIAAYIETQIKMYAYQTDDANSKSVVEGSDSTSLMKVLKTAGYDRTFGIWVPTADLGEYKIAAWVGLMAPKDPGSATWKFKTGRGITSDSFTTQEKTNIKGKNGNIYITIAGVDMFEEGKVASGEFVDIIVGTDWIQSRIQEEVFALFVAEDKVPYSDGGIEAIVLQVENVLDQAVQRTILLGGEDGPVVTAPRRSETEAADRAARFLRDIRFTGLYAGAIHKTQIDGTLSI
jgi:hypothetical protein